MASEKCLHLTNQEGTAIARRSLFSFFGSEEAFRKMNRISFGWKFHVAAIPGSFESILEILKPAAAIPDFLLKGLKDPFLLNRMKGTPQQGKAFTLYFPQEQFETARLVAERITKALAARITPPYPTIYEKSFPGSSFVFYRFGEYEAGKTVVNRWKVPGLGTVHACSDGHSWFTDRFERKWLIGPGRELWMDRWPGNHKPPWIQDPFQS